MSLSVYAEHTAFGIFYHAYFTFIPTADYNSNIISIKGIID